jgi:periplasmic protein TonB
VISKANRRRYLPVILMTVAVSVLGVGAFAVVRGILNSAPGQPKQVIQEIHLMRPPPPPPDLPPPPPPPEEKVQVHEKPPDAKSSDEPPPGERLGLDAQGGAGSDAFGLLGNKGGRDLLASGGGAFVWYAGLLKSEILERLQDERDAHKGSYSAEVRVWVAADGTIERAHLSQSTGDPVRDKAIEAALSHLPRLSQARPVDMPQPITLRIVSRA